MQQPQRHNPLPGKAVPNPAEQIFLGRQPILDKQGSIAAFELLFRSGSLNRASFADGSVATATVINHAFVDLGIEAVLGEYRGFINFDTALLMSDLVELLPRDKIVIELLETIEITDDVISRVQFLKSQGYIFALDDMRRADISKAKLFQHIDIFKVEIAGVSASELRQMVAALCRYPVRLLAEKVDTHEQAALCRELGFELFQGYYFAKPLVLSRRKVSPATNRIMRLIGLGISDANAEDIEAVFREDPDLTVSLLRVVNSVAVGARQRITSISHALMVLGRNQLSRWLQILMYTLGDAPGVKHPSPLTTLASIRGRFMEQVSTGLHSSNTSFRERAFMVGILSLSDALLGMPLAEIVQPLPLDVEVKRALLNRSGLLGTLMNLTVALESSDQRGVADALAALPALSPELINRAQIEAMEWADSLGRPAG